jgi:hypothetical protein
MVTGPGRDGVPEGWERAVAAPGRGPPRPGVSVHRQRIDDGRRRQGARLGPAARCAQQQANQRGRRRPGRPTRPSCRRPARWCPRGATAARRCAWCRRTVRQAAGADAVHDRDALRIAARQHDGRPRPAVAVAGLQDEDGLDAPAGGDPGAHLVASHRSGPGTGSRSHRTSRAGRWSADARGSAAARPADLDLAVGPGRAARVRQPLVGPATPGQPPVGELAAPLPGPVPPRAGAGRRFGGPSDTAVTGTSSTASSATTHAAPDRSMHPPRRRPQAQEPYGAVTEQRRLACVSRAA